MCHERQSTSHLLTEEHQKKPDCLYVYRQPCRLSGYIRENRSVIAFEFITSYYAGAGIDERELAIYSARNLNKMPVFNSTKERLGMIG